MWKTLRAAAVVGAAATFGLAAQVGTASASPTVSAGPTASASPTASARASVRTGAGARAERVVVPLTAEPTGTVEVTETTSGHLQARMDLIGVTPGSSHAVQLFPFGRSSAPRPVAFPDVTANGVGAIDTTVTSTTRAPRSAFGELVVRLGPTGVTGADASLAAQATAEAWVSPAVPSPVPVVPVSLGLGPMGGWATLAYDPTAKTLTVKVTAWGFTPGTSHAAHIHLGSCAAQGPVDYMIPDLVANSWGAMIGEQRVLTGVTSFTTPAGGWYLNIHLGTSANILDSAGNPTIHFRPLLCGDIND